MPFLEDCVQWGRWKYRVSVITAMLFLHKTVQSGYELGIITYTQKVLTLELDLQLCAW